MGVCPPRSRMCRRLQEALERAGSPRWSPSPWAAAVARHRAPPLGATRAKQKLEARPGGDGRGAGTLAELVCSDAAPRGRRCWALPGPVGDVLPKPCPIGPARACDLCFASDLRPGCASAGNTRAGVGPGRAVHGRALARCIVAVAWAAHRLGRPFVDRCCTLKGRAASGSHVVVERQLRVPEAKISIGKVASGRTLT